MTTDTETRADAYLAEVRRHLQGLTDDERDDLLDDLTAHVHQVAADDERPLEESLGPPEAFAAELLASAGLTAEIPALPRRGLIARARGRVDSAIAAVRRQPAGRAVLDFLPELRPAWWVVRGWLVVYLLTMPQNGDDTASFPFPEILDSWVAGSTAAALGAVISVHLGRRRTPTRWVWLVNAAAIVSAVLIAGDLQDRNVMFVDEADSGGSVYVIDPPFNAEPGVRRGDNAPITNIYAYDANGQLLDRVRLYDQEGRPIAVYPGYDANGLPLATEPVIGPDGQEVTNAYPLHQATNPRFPGDPSGNIAVPPPLAGVAPLPAPGTVTPSTTVPAPVPSGPTTVPGSVP
jgi:hypothetical protein